MAPTKILIVTYYWPPSGGAGVQRWLKLSKYLAHKNTQLFVITVDADKASYMQTDASLEQDIDPRIAVIRTSSFEPINIYARVVGKKNVPTSGFSNIKKMGVLQRLVASARSHAFIPDPRKGWNSYAIKAAADLIKKEKIDCLVTTSPPHSTQLIGLALKKKFNLTWIADLRDPWTDIYYYPQLQHSAWSARRDKALELAVLNHSDKLITVSDHLRKLFLSKLDASHQHKIAVIPNGFDPHDFENKLSRKNELLTICYTGTMSETYQPEAFIAVLEKFSNTLSSPIKMQFVGSVSSTILAKITHPNIQVECISTVPHDEVVNYQVHADVLLLVIPDTSHSEGILTGKLFEYLASRNPILGVGPSHGDASAIIRKCEAGQVFDRTDDVGMLSFLQRAHAHFLSGEKTIPNEEAILSYSRDKQAEQVLQLFEK